MKNLIVLAVLIFVILVAGLIAVRAQLPAGYTEATPVRDTNLPFDSGGHSHSACFLRADDGIYDEAKLKPLLEKPECAEEIKALKVDFARHTLVAWSAHSDCHMGAATKVFRSDTDKKYLVITNIIYGGCRASGSRQGWIVLDKIPAGYTLEMKEVRIDRIHGPQTEGFQFPKAPSNIKPEPMESREVDVKDCLPLERQSQWILIKSEYLKTALENKGPECAEHFRNLAIDFDKYTLAGYNVNTGDCGRPAGLEQKAFRDAGENRYVLEISYPRRSGSCHVPIWHAVWVLVPKLPEGYSFDFEVREKKSQPEKL
jgi:hypothetical protein